MINELEQIKQRILKEYEASGLPVIYAEAYCDEMMLPMSDGAALKTYIFRGCKDGAYAGNSSALALCPCIGNI